MTRIKNGTDSPNKFLSVTPSTETPPAVLANCIATISRGINELRDSRLTDRAIITLVHDDTGVAKRTIQLVLDSLSQLERTYLKPKHSRPSSLLTGPR